jgi:hypothetical protein
MKINHLSDSDIQGYVLGELQEISIRQHIHGCSNCAAKVEAYRQIIAGIQEQPGAEFDFNLSESVISGIVERNSIYSYANLFWLVAMIGVAAIVITGYLFWKYIVNLFPGVSDMPMYFVVTTAATLFLFLGLDMVRKYKRQMDTLNFS